ncbi:MAG: Flp family type IVb pilin [Thermomicrobiales bacterium]|nr:Flp family type IVb pilin [Thermomicrobiales bacterium]
MLLYVEYFLAKAGIVLSDEEGQGLIEYVLIAALISIAAIAAIRIVGPAVSDQFDTVGTALTTP